MSRERLRERGEGEYMREEINGEIGMTDEKGVI